MILLHVFRWIAFFYYGPWEFLLAEKKMDLLKAFVVSLRFDGVTICYALILPLLGYLIWMLAPSKKMRVGLVRFERIYFVFLVSFLGALAGLDLGYYSYFQDHINVLIFGFFDDDTWALVQTFQKNYPISLIFFLALICLSNLIWSSFKLFRSDRWEMPASRYQPQLWLSYFAVVVALGIGARGSLGLFPLHEIDAAVSSEPFINYLGYSGVHGLHRALKVRSSNKTVWNTNGNFYGYQNWEQAAQDHWNLKPQDLPKDPLDLLKQTTAKNSWAEKTRPHVVVLLIESWGGFWMQFDSETFNVLGDFKSHLAQDFTFMNFLPSMGATIGSLTALMVNSPHRPEGNFLSESRYMQVPFRISPAQVYKKAGYRTRFVYGGGIGWRSVDRFAKTQGFDSIEGDFAIEQKLSKKLEKHDWGIYDGDVFQYVEQTLNEATSPEFVFVLTTSNHPPYQIPADYKPHSLTAPEELQSKFTSDREIVDARFQSYQYANQMLGELMSRIKSSPLGEKLVLGATGDHGFLLINYGEGDYLQKWQVPFYVYIPKSAQFAKTAKDQVLERFGSHMDIFPTLFELSLSNTTHYSFGHNLFQDQAPHRAFHFSRLAMNKSGAVIAEKSSQYFSWSEKNPMRLQASAVNPELAALDKSYRSIMGFLDYFYEYELQQTQKGTEDYANTRR